jgi:glycosyltransferase involved in cell wall biosynthesis
MMRRVSRPLRLAYLADPNSVHTRRWLQSFVERGHRVALVVDDRDLVRPGLPDEVRVCRYRRLGAWRLPAVSSLQGRGPLRDLLRTIGPDLVHAHYLTRYGWQARLSGFRPYVVSPWGSDLFVTPSQSVRARLWARSVLVNADLVTVVSDQMRAEVRRYGVDADRIERVAFGVDTERYTPSPDASAPAVVGNRRYLLSPRAIAPNYRPDVVIDAFATLPSDVALVMTTRNADPATLAAARSRIDDRRIGERVLLLDSIDDDLMRRLFQSATAVVSVPESDAVSISVLEAMACGSPVVATDLPGIREHLGRSAPELLVPIGDPVSTASALRRVLEMPTDERRRVGQALRDDAVRTADHRANMDRMELLYRQLAESRR